MIEVETRRNSRRTLLLIILICAAPVVAAYVAFYFWQPTHHLNHGELLTPQILDWKDVQIVQGDRLAERLQGKWVLLYASDGGCDDACEKALYYTRQIRTAQAKEMARVTRVWLLQGPAHPLARVLDEHPDLIVMRASQIEQILPRANEKARYVYLIDPRNNLIMRYGQPLVPRDMMQDLQRLLKYSQVG